MARPKNADIDALRAAARDCRAFWRNASQTVFGEAYAALVADLEVAARHLRDR